MAKTIENVLVIWNSTLVSSLTKDVFSAYKTTHSQSVTIHS